MSKHLELATWLDIRLSASLLTNGNRLPNWYLPEAVRGKWLFVTAGPYDNATIRNVNIVQRISKKETGIYRGAPERSVGDRE